jgi:hypothetical protein
MIMKVDWNDPRLSWNASSYNNITQVLLPASKVWTPDLVVVSEAFFFFNIKTFTTRNTYVYSNWHFKVNSVNTNIFLVGSLLSSIYVLVDNTGQVNMIFSGAGLQTRCAMVHIT